MGAGAAKIQWPLKKVRNSGRGEHPLLSCKIKNLSVL
jgi:hypothetical protein